MKTLTCLLTLLALTIHVLVIGQTQNNRSRKILVDIMGTNKPVKMNYANSNITLSITEYNQLLEQAKTLKINAQKLRDDAITIDQQYLIKQIEVSELSAKITYQKFEQNKEVIFDLFNKTPKTNYPFTKAQGSNTEAERFMKMAKEMREEANAQLTIQAKYGNMSNAEENEALALDKQNEVLELFINSYPQLVQNIPTLVTENMDKSIQELEITSEKSNDVLAFQKSDVLIDVLAGVFQQAEDMKITAQQLRMNALSSSSNQKAVLINEAVSLENDHLLKQVEISVIKSKMDYEKFLKNRIVITTLIKSVKNNAAIVDKANELNNEAERLMKIGKEMREEAIAQLTNAAKYGAMTNAEETELFAIGKQVESIQFIEKENIEQIVASK